MSEPAQALRAYQDYRDMLPPRSFERLIESYRTRNPDDPTPPTMRLASLKKWSARYHWQERIAQHEAEIAAAADAQAKTDRLADIERRRRQRLAIADVEHRIVIARLRQMVDRDGNLTEKIKPAEAVMMGKHADETERLELGDVTSRVGVQWEELSDADLLARARALGLIG